MQIPDIFDFHIQDVVYVNSDVETYPHLQGHRGKVVNVILNADTHQKMVLVRLDSHPQAILPFFPYELHKR